MNHVTSPLNHPEPDAEHPSEMEEEIHQPLPWTLPQLTVAFVVMAIAALLVVVAFAPPEPTCVVVTRSAT